MSAPHDSAARLRVLADVSHAFAMVATSYQALLDRIATTAAELVGDGCQVTLLEPDGDTLINAANAHRDPALAADYRAYLAGLGRGVSKATSASVSATVARSGEPRLVAEVDPATLVAQTDEALKPLVARLNVHSFAVVPIPARQSIIGTLSLMRCRPGAGYTRDDLTLLQELADRAGLAIENARLYDNLERRVRQRTAELEAVNHELEAFSYSVAHDLRAPLRRIDGFSQTLLEDYGERLDDAGRQNLRRVREAAQHMARLIDDLLELSRVTRSALQRGHVDLSALTQAVVNTLQAAEPGRQVEVVVEAGLIVEGDNRLLAIVMENLVGNSWKFTRKRADPRIEIGAHQGWSDRPTAYFVRDNGAGFDMAYVSKLFGVFQRLHTETDFEGTGIGLATVQRIVQRHGGRIWAEGAVDRGATFSFTLEEG